MKPLLISIALLLVASGCSSNSDSRPANDATTAPDANGAAPETPTSPIAPSTPDATTPADSGRRVPPGSESGGPNKGCGGFLGDTCSAEEYCAYEPGQHCGAADASATCKPRPQACTKEYRPVCGCDNKKYGNRCEANAAGVGILNDGECSAG